MSRGHGAAQRYLLDLLFEADTWVGVAEAAELRARGHAPGTPLTTQRRRWLYESLLRGTPVATPAQVESMRRAAQRLRHEGLIDTTYGPIANSLVVTLTDRERERRRVVGATPEAWAALQRFNDSKGRWPRAQ